MADEFDINEFNRQIIEEFRANGGTVTGQFAGTPLLLLHTTGAKSGKERVSPVAFKQLDGAWAVFGSKAGAPTHPDWFHNLQANPQVTIEVGAETIPVTARVAEGDEREVIWTEHKAEMPGFAEYEKNTTREIPVIVLESR